jgi:malate dehydrogenase (oxaloacetate-decarboxylating)(NADP+)
VRNPEEAYSYTSKANLVAVISNGTAILGLGNLGALASKPVMEGKGILFKRFADVDVFDIELNTTDPERIIEAVKLMEPTFGGINLEDIRSPECFYIEKRLVEECSIPVFHDDQHGTAIICTAGIMNASELVNKPLDSLRVVFNGAGAAGIACARMFVTAGIPRENITLCDIDGVIYRGRDKVMTAEHLEFAADTPHRKLSDAMRDADVFVGLSVGNCVTGDMIAPWPPTHCLRHGQSGARDKYEEAVSARGDLIMATGRSDYPNQINNVLGFPFIFRGALDVRARKISEGMKMAAARSLAALAREPVPGEVIRAYGRDFSFGPEYIVPKPFDHRVIEYEAVAVAMAACSEGLAAKPLADWEAYRSCLRDRMARYWK